MADRITGDQPSSLVHKQTVPTGDVHRAGDANVEGGGEEKREIKERPAPTGAKTAVRRLDSPGMRIVLEGVGLQLEKMIRELEKTPPNVSQVSAPLRKALTQLEQLKEIDADTRPALVELSGLAHRLLEAAMGKEGAEKHLGNIPLQLSNKVAELGIKPIFEELCAASPIAPKALEALLNMTGQRDTILRELARMYPGADAFGGIKVLTDKLDKDLGPLKQEIASLMAKQQISEKQIEQFFGAFAEVRQGFEIGAAKGDDFQRTNWVHTRIEVLHTLQAAAGLGLDAHLTLDAMLGALASDSFKDASTFSLLWHNRGGGELVVPLLRARHFPESKPAFSENPRRVALEHQITPPIFMSGAMKFFIGVGTPGVDEIVKAIDEPNQASQKNGEVVFSKEAALALQAKGIPGWAVLDPKSPHYLASVAAIVGDVMQYPGFDGVIKYAFDIRDPEEKRPFMRDDLIQKAVNSSLEFSFSQGMKVVEDERMHALANEYKASMKRAIEQVAYPRVDARLRQELGVDQDAKILYWNKPVVLPLLEGQRAIIDRVKRTLAEEASKIGGVPLDPFGHIAKREGRA